MNEVNIEVTSDDHTKAGFLSARREVASFGDGVSKMLSGLKGIAVAAGADLASSLAGPLVAAAGVATAAFASAGAAIGAFGLAVKPQADAIGEVTKAWDKYKAAAPGAEQDAAFKEYIKTLDGLPPATQEAASEFLALRESFGQWSDSLAGDTMPVFSKGLRLARDLLPSLTPLVKAGAGALSGFMDTLARDAQGGGFQRFTTKLADAASKTLPSFLRSIRNVAVGFGGLLSAFLPFSAGMSGGLEDLTKKFADFGQGLEHNQGFQDWMAGVSEQAPDLLDLLGDLIQIIVNVGQALAPFTGLTLKVTEALADFVAAIPQDVMDWLAPTIGGIVLAIKAWSVAQGILNIALAANPIGLVVIAIAALVGGLIYAYKHSETFRRIVDEAFSVVKEKGVDLWEKIQPGLELMGEMLGETLPEAASFLAGAIGDLADEAENVAEKILGINGSLEETPESGSSVIDWLKENWEPVIATMLAGPFAGAVAAILDKFNLITGGLQFFGDYFIEHWDNIWQGTIRSPFVWLEKAREIVHGIIGRIAHAVLSPWPGVQKRFNEFWAQLGVRAHAGINRVYSAVIGVVHRIAGIRPSWSGLWHGLAAAGSRVVGLLEGILNRAKSIGSKISGIISHIPGFATGGISHAAEGGPRGNLVMVGEHGRELVRLPFGSSVIPNGQTENMLADRGPALPLDGTRPSGPMVLNLSVTVENHGAIGSRIELEDWLTAALASLRKQGRLVDLAAEAR
ncbi:hypothetical protein GCM10022254_10020 [Actinomadura meridiana]|uniref:Uncharacterized protein n=1 Tax=Actinomadura meridiana TaxID=559626 RepID=A0ABP8BTV4_9ACTN